MLSELGKGDLRSVKGDAESVVGRARCALAKFGDLHGALRVLSWHIHPGVQYFLTM